MPRSRHEHPLARITRALRSQNVRHSVGDTRSHLLFTNCWKSVGPQRFGLAPRPGRIEDRPHLELSRAAGRLAAHDEGRVLASLRLRLVEALARNARDAVRKAERRSNRSEARERREIAIDHGSRGWQLLVDGRLP